MKGDCDIWSFQIGWNSDHAVQHLRTDHLSGPKVSPRERSPSARFPARSSSLIEYDNVTQISTDGSFGTANHEIPRCAPCFFQCTPIIAVSIPDRMSNKHDPSSQPHSGRLIGREVWSKSLWPSQETIILNLAIWKQLLRGCVWRTRPPLSCLCPGKWRVAVREIVIWNKSRGVRNRTTAFGKSSLSSQCFDDPSGGLDVPIETQCSLMIDVILLCRRNPLVPRKRPRFLRCAIRGQLFLVSPLIGSNLRFCLPFCVRNSSNYLRIKRTERLGRYVPKYWSEPPLASFSSGVPGDFQKFIQYWKIWP
jgi:hypothetical protein